jgi:hypothetical protein
MTAVTMTTITTAVKIPMLSMYPAWLSVGSPGQRTNKIDFVTIEHNQQMSETRFMNIIVFNEISVIYLPI